MAIGTLVYFLIIIGLFLGISRGMGSLGGSLRDMAFFSMEKAPVGLVDLFSKKKGSAATSWMTLGLIWMPIASTLTFLNLWLGYDSTALMSAFGDFDREKLSSAAYIATFWGFLGMTLIGAGFHIQNRMLGSKISSEAGASMLSLFWFLLTLVLIVISFTSLAPHTTHASAYFTAYGILALGVLAAHLMTIYDNKKVDMSTPSWLIILSLGALIYGTFSNVCYFLNGSEEVAWNISKALHGWWLVPMSMAIATFLIPKNTGNLLWSKLLSMTGIILIFLTITPFTSYTGQGLGSDDNILTIQVSLWSTLALIPIFAMTFNLIATMRGRWESMVESTSTAASMVSIMLLPLGAIGGLFASISTFGGDASLAGIGASMDHLLLWGVGGLAAFAALNSMLPESMGLENYERSRQRLAFWFVAIGAIGSSLMSVMSDFVNQAVEETGYLASVNAQQDTTVMIAVMFYFFTIGTFVAAHQFILTRSRGEPLGTSKIEGTGIAQFSLISGDYTIRGLLEKGLSLDTKILVNEEISEEELGETKIRVSAGLHETEGVDTSISTDTADEILWQLSDYLKTNNLKIFDVFKQLDEDSSMTLTAYEFREGLNKLGLANLPPHEVNRLVSALDMNGDGIIDLPELGLAFTRDLMPAKIIKPNKEEVEEANLSKLKKAELVEIAKERGIDSSGTKKEILERLN
jgi:cbb3-type cytochrome oxidase subunit 1